MKTKRVRIAVAINCNGDWRTISDGDSTDDHNINRSMFVSKNSAYHIVVADIPIPEPVESVVVEGEVKDE